MKRIEWVKWRDPLKPHKEEKFEVQALKDSYDAESYAEEESESRNVKMIAGPYGLIPVAEHGLASSQYKLWVMHTNFNISGPIVNVINKIDGVEILRVWTRYRCWLGIGNLFEVEKVQEAIEKALGANKKEVKKPNPVIKKLIKKLAEKYNFWIIFKDKNEKLDFISGETKEEVLEKMGGDHCSIESSMVAKSWE